MATDKKPNKRRRKYINPNQQKLLEYLMEAENRFKSVTQICIDVGITRKAYYIAFHDDIFLAKYKEESYNITKQAVAPVINACVKQAKIGSFKHAELLLKMAGMIDETAFNTNDEATKARAVSVNVFVDALKGAAAEVWQAPIIDGKPAKENKDNE